MEGKPRILGVDDSLTIRKALEIVLKPAGYELELAVDGADALAKAKSFRPALILLDFILPDMRGSEVCQHLALDPETSHIPVILVSAKGAEIRQAYRDARNVVSYIAKPFKPQVVTSIVADVLAKLAAGELVKSSVAVHEADGSAVPPSIAASIAPAPAAATIGQTPQTAPPRMQAEAAVPAAVQPGEVSFEPSREAETRLDWEARGPAATTTESVAAARDESEEGELEEAFALATPVEPVRREALELMFETLRASIEGVYVEEVDTPLGAAADQAKSYTDLLDNLTRELGEGLRHARSDTRYLMYGDGSVRSLDESLLEIFRRACRLLFRAVNAGAVSNEAPAARRRVLVVCQKDSQVARHVPAMLAVHPDWQVFTICEGFRQLPMMMRLYGPTEVIAEATWSGALWDQLRQMHQLPEARDVRVIGVQSPDHAARAVADASPRATALQERGIVALVDSVFDVDRHLDRHAETASEDIPAPAAAVVVNEASASF